MMIIIDGCDGVGKGYLIEKLAKKLPKSIVLKITDRPKNNSVFEKNKIKKYYNDVFKIYKKISDYNIILDRYYSSELVYSFKRGYEAFFDDWYKKFEEKLLQENVLFVYINRDKKEIIETFDTRGDEFLKKSEIDKVKYRYNQFIKKTKLPVIRVTSNDYDKVIAKILIGGK